MNKLSWFIYLSEVAGNFKVALILISLGLIGFLGTRYIAVGLHNEDYPKSEPWTYPAYKLVITIAICGGLLAAIMPSRNTMYAIAASEVGEMVIQNETVQGLSKDATKALQQWIKRQIEPETSTKK